MVQTLRALASLPLAFVLLLIGSLAVPYETTAAAGDTGDSRWTTFTTQDGLVADNILAIWGDGSAVWFGTDQGLSRYDGTRWQSFTVADGLPGSRVQALWGDGRGQVWAGTDAGVARYDGAAWRAFTGKDGLPGNNVRGLWGDGQGRVWAALEPGSSGQATGGVAVWDGTRWRQAWEPAAFQSSLVYTQEFGLPGYTITTNAGGRFAAARAIAGDQQGNLWVGHGLALGDGSFLSGGVSRLTGDSWTRFTSATSPLPDDNVNALWVEPGGGLWIGTSAKGVCRYDAGQWQIFGEAATRPMVLALWGDGRGTVWAGTVGGGASRYDGRAWRQFTAADGLGSDTVQAIRGDGQGRVWFGTDRGATLYDSTHWFPWRSGDGLPASAVSALWGDGAGGLWFGTAGAGVAVYRAGQWRTFTEGDGLPGSAVSAIWGNGPDDVWVAVRGPAVAHFDGYRWETLPRLQTLDLVTGLWRDPRQNLWLATDGGFKRFDGWGWRTYTKNDGLAANSVTRITGDRAGNLWFSYRWFEPQPENSARFGWPGGVGLYDGQQWRYFTRQDGLGSDYVRALWVDERDQVWAGGIGPLSRYDGRRWQMVEGGPGGVTAIWGDGRGTLWFASQQMIPGGDGAELEAVVTRFDGVTWRAYTSSRDGLASGTVTALWGDDAGRLWAAHDNFYGGSGGVSYFDGTRWRIWQAGEGPPAPEVQALAQDAAGRTWIGTRKGISVFDGTRWRSFGLSDGLVSLDVEDLWVAPDGEVWAAHALSSVYPEQGGVSRFDGERWSHYGPADGLGGKDVAAIWGDGQGNVWVGGRQDVSSHDKNWVARFDGQSWNSYPVEGGSVEAIWGDAEGTVWFRMAQGANSFDGRAWRYYPSLRSLVEARYTDLSSQPASNPLWTVDGDGRVWITEGRGAARYDGRSWQAFGSATGLAGDEVAASVLDQSGTVWFATEDGLSRTDGRSWRTYRVANSGLGNDNTQRISVNPDGSLSFGTDLWTTRYVPAPPQVRIERLVSLADGQIFLPAAGLRLENRQRSVQIEFSALAPWTSPRDLTYRYRLAGAEAGWRFLDNPTREAPAAAVQYAELAPGAYTFEVAAGNRDLDYSAVASLAFVVRSAAPAVSLAAAAVDGAPAEIAGGDLTLAPRFLPTPRRVALAVALNDDLDPAPALFYRLDRPGQPGTLQPAASNAGVSLTLASAPGAYVLALLGEDREGNRSPELAVHITVPPPQSAAWLPFILLGLTAVGGASAGYTVWRWQVWRGTPAGRAWQAWRTITRSPDALLDQAAGLFQVCGPDGPLALARLASRKRRPDVAAVARAVAELAQPETVAGGLAGLLAVLEDRPDQAATARWYRALRLAWQASSVGQMAGLLTALEELMGGAAQVKPATVPALGVLRQAAALAAGAQATPMERQGSYFNDALSVLVNHPVEAAAAALPAPDRAAFGHVVAAWRVIITRRWKEVMTPALVHGRLRTLWVLPADPVTLALEVTNRGQGVATTIRVVLPPGGEVVAGLPLLPPGETEIVEFQAQLAEDPTSVALELIYDDREASGKREMVTGLVHLRQPAPWIPFRNPYVVGRPAEPDSPVFVGREDVFDFVRSGLREGGRQNAFALIAQRRMGKTSVLEQLPGRLGPGVICVRLECLALGTGVDTAGLLYEIAYRVGATLREAGLPAPPADLAAIRRSPWLGFEQDFLRPGLAGLGGRRLLWLLDELEAWAGRVQQGRLNAEIFGFLRHLAESYDALALLIAGTPRLFRFSGTGVSPLLNLAATCRMDALDETAGRRLIVEPLAGLVTWHDLAITRLLGLTGGHPYFLQAACWLLADHCLAEQRGFVGPQDIEVALHEIWELTESHLRELWDENSALERLLLSALARLEPQPGAHDANAIVDWVASAHGLRLERGPVMAGLEALVERQVLRRAGETRYAYLAPLVGRWVAAARSIDAVIEEVYDGAS